MVSFADDCPESMTEGCFPAVIPSYPEFIDWNNLNGMNDVNFAPAFFWNYNIEAPRDGEIDQTEACEIDALEVKFECYNSAQFRFSEGLLCGVFATSPLIVPCAGYVYWNYEYAKQSCDIQHEVDKAKCD